MPLFGVDPNWVRPFGNRLSTIGRWWTDIYGWNTTTPLEIGWADQPVAEPSLQPGLNIPNAAGASDPVNPNAILILQQLADRGIGTGTMQAAENPQAVNNGNSFYPINFYDEHEGNSRDTNLAGTQCNVNGIMNAVEIDVGDLRRWLGHAIGGRHYTLDQVRAHSKTATCSTFWSSAWFRARTRLRR